MMGAGKSTVGPALARRLGHRFADTDAEIERVAGCSIADLFAAEGEDVFRTRERAAIDALAGERVVVALGGGAIAQPGASAHLAGTGTVVYLRARPETLLARLGDCSGRPLLAGVPPGDRLERVKALLAERADAYESAALVIDTDALSAAALADEVARRIEVGLG
jgi:shikimate kinase